MKILGNNAKIFPISSGLMKKKKVSAVIPCLNEEETIGICVKKAKDCFSSLNIEGEVIVSDNGSTDLSVEIAKEAGARVVHQKKIKGYGAALAKGIEEAKGEYIIMADADDSYDWSAMEPFIAKLDEGYDLVIGNRFKGQIKPGAMPFLHKYLGNPVLSFLAKTFYHAPIGDFHCGMRAFTKDAYKRMRLKTLGMEFATEMIANAVKEQLKITEIPIILYSDKRSGPSHLHSFRDGWRHLKFILIYAPNYLYIFPGLVLFVLGAILQLALISGPIHISGFFIGIHFLALGCLMSLVGFNILNLGIFAKVIDSRHRPHMQSGIVSWILNDFRLEVGLIIGTILVFVGLIIDMILFVRWLSVRGPMESSIHIAFVATNMIAMGLSISFDSFLLSLFTEEIDLNGKHDK